MVSSSQLSGCCAGPGEKRTYIVEVDVDTAIMGEYEVSYSVCTLYRLGIIVEGV